MGCVRKSLRTRRRWCSCCSMKTTLVLFCLVLFCASALAAAKAHVTALGKWTTVKWLSDEDEDKVSELKVRPLFVDGRAKDFTVGPVHDVTERMFVVQRMFRLNDSLPQENGPTRWRWEVGGWLLVDRLSGKVQAVNLPEFDPYHSSVNWFRDYAAYCGTSDDGKKAFAMIIQLGRRKPLLKKTVAENQTATCAAPSWQRDPPRATFDPEGAQKFTFSVRSRAVDLVTEDEESSSEESPNHDGQ
jgi:hypothetical protein